MADSPNLALPYIEAAQAQKHVTHNEAIRALDALVQIAVLDRDLTAPPTSPEDGARYIISAGATGLWVGHDAEIAAWQDGAWVFYPPRNGWLAWVGDEETLLVWSGTQWIAATSATGSASVNPTPLVGVNATADATNRFVVSSPATLLNHAGAGHQLKINKNGNSDTASLLFQDNFSSRAEIGLTGDDDFRVKVSANGASFRDAIRVDRTTGEVSFPNSDFIASQIFSIMGDGGRFAGSPEPAISATAFTAPSWVALLNGGTFTNYGKFIHNSSSYGGTSAAIDPNIAQLHNTIFSDSVRRYAPEYYVAQITAGAGTGSMLAFPDAISRYGSLYTQAFSRPVVITVSYYIKALDAAIGIPTSVARNMYLDGVLQTTANFVIPANGAWHHVLSIEIGAPKDHYRYSYAAMLVYFAASGHRALFAAPALVPGRIKLPVDIGHVPGIKGWGG